MAPKRHDVLVFIMAMLMVFSLVFAGWQSLRAFWVQLWVDHAADQMANFERLRLMALTSEPSDADLPHYHPQSFRRPR
jgi:hypothetical protein